MLAKALHVQLGIVALALSSLSTIAFVLPSSNRQHPTTTPPSANKFSRIVTFSTTVDHENNRPPDKFTRPIKPQLIKSQERSSFWYADSNCENLTPEQVLPYQPKLDTDGPLPFGSYRIHGDSQFDPKQTCIVTAGLTFQNVKNKNEIETDMVVANAHKMIDSGFTSFQLNIPSCKRVKARDNEINSGTEPTMEQTWIEENVYGRLVQETPPSVLSLCNLGTKLRVPYWNYEGSVRSGSMFRQQVGESILNIFGHTGGCIDSLQVDFRAGNEGRMSPFTFDVMNILYDMQREGLIRSICGVDFPASALQELKECGFHFDTNQVTCNLLNPNDYYGDLEKFCKQTALDGKPMKIIRDSPLAGGLLTDKFCKMPNKSRSRKGAPLPQNMTPSERWNYKNELEGSWLKNYNHRESTGITKNDLWVPFEKKVMDTLHNIALKHRVDVASVAIRWAMQQDHLGSILVGTNLNARYDSDHLFTRPRDLRRSFAVHLDEEDMDRLWSVSGAEPYSNEFEDEFDPAKDFSNTRLWL